MFLLTCCGLGRSRGYEPIPEPVNHPESVNRGDSEAGTVRNSLLASDTIEGPNLLIVSDPGFDVDDSQAHIVGSGAMKRREANLVGVISTTEPSQDRALLSKGTLISLGHSEVPVAVGENHHPEGWKPEAQRLQAPFLPHESAVERDAQAMLKRIYGEAKDRSLTPLLIAQMGDAAKFMRNNEELFTQKTKNMVIMGGVKQNSEAADLTHEDIRLSDDQYLVANKIATNNRHNQDAADYVYRKAQELQIPLTIVTRKAATAVPVQKTFFADQAKTKQEVAVHLHEKIEKDFLQKFWQGSYRGDLGAERTAEWFIKTFCEEGTPKDLGFEDDITPHLKSRVLYDSVALLAALPKYHHLFSPTEIETNGTKHSIIGLSGKNNGLADPEGIARAIKELSREALTSLPSVTA